MKHAMILLLLAGCAPQPPVMQPVTVDVPVAVPCHVPETAKPDFALVHVRPGDSVADKARAALAELDQRKAYEAELESQFILCR